MGKFTIDVPPGHSVIKSGENCYQVVGIGTEHLPTTWEEFCNRTELSPEECFISNSSIIRDGSEMLRIHPSNPSERDYQYHKNILPDRITAEAVLALMQLTQLKKCYNGGWKPDWSNSDEFKYVIMNKGNQLGKSCSIHVNYVLSFRTEALRDHFLTSFRDLIETAKSLI